MLIKITLETLKITLIHHNIDAWNAIHFEYTFSMFLGNLKVCQTLKRVLDYHESLYSEKGKMYYIDRL